jgi:hypothetical protein
VLLPLPLLPLPLLVLPLLLLPLPLLVLPLLLLPLPPLLPLPLPLPPPLLPPSSPPEMPVFVGVLDEQAASRIIPKATASHRAPTPSRSFIVRPSFKSQSNFSHM